MLDDRRGRDWGANVVVAVLVLVDVVFVGVGDAPEDRWGRPASDENAPGPGHEVRSDGLRARVPLAGAKEDRGDRSKSSCARCEGEMDAIIASQGGVAMMAGV